LRKKNRILELYHQTPSDGIVLCYDEWGPLELKPIHGQTWAFKNKPNRLRATYRRLSGTEQFFGFYEVHTDYLFGTIHKRKCLKDMYAVFQQLRNGYSMSYRLYVIMDNLPVHKNKVLLKFFDTNNIEAVWTPTYSSWLNLIEAQFGIMKRFTLNNSDDLHHNIRRKRIYRYLNYRNKKLNINKCISAKAFKH